MTYLPQDAIISEAKLTKYLLVLLPKDDKSQFLAQAGYTIENWQQLEQDLREQVLPLEAIQINETEFGVKYRIRGSLIGPNGTTIQVITIWIIDSLDRQTKFVTLFPDKER
ncbi:hypothetical protein NIES2119_01660 [[Phormidium ambiguum] IAM M-71]|uniref:DUF6883 domain-containing protein n=1 Tax=[Phormidium ambiguum] IAM M-71 TaxID=454136 RepID=A0A1U7IS64_9CYAN|nr:DUF6883 domain-containing protein [Phormidium ambiguum]OKH40357.1 hypothetical protein NIES2119_01660 [Phormidium ambiguum IAM M-71]